MRAVDAITRRSQAIASSAPPPIASPLMNAMVGTAVRRTASSAARDELGERGRVVVRADRGEIDEVAAGREVARAGAVDHEVADRLVVVGRSHRRRECGQRVAAERVVLVDAADRDAGMHADAIHDDRRSRRAVGRIRFVRPSRSLHRADRVLVVRRHAVSSRRLYDRPGSRTRMFVPYTEQVSTIWNRDGELRRHVGASHAADLRDVRDAAAPAVADRARAGTRHPEEQLPRDRRDARGSRLPVHADEAARPVSDEEARAVDGPRDGEGRVHPAGDAAARGAARPDRRDSHPRQDARPVGGLSRSLREPSGDPLLGRAGRSEAAPFELDRQGDARHVQGGRTAWRARAAADAADHRRDDDGPRATVRRHPPFARSAAGTRRKARTSATCGRWRRRWRWAASTSASRSPARSTG